MQPQRAWSRRDLRPHLQMAHPMGLPWIPGVTRLHEVPVHCYRYCPGGQKGTLAGSPEQPTLVIRHGLRLPLQVTKKQEKWPRRDRLEGWRLRPAAARGTSDLAQRAILGGRKEAKENVCFCHLAAQRHLGKQRQRTKPEEASPPFSYESHSKRLHAPGLSPGELTGAASGQRPLPAFPWAPWVSRSHPPPPKDGTFAFPGS